METILYQPTENLRQRESRIDKFNDAVVRQLEKDFANTHDVCHEYFTHAFPYDNLENIVKNGGLLTPNELRRRGVEFKQGSDASFGGTVFFGKDEIQSGYGIVENMGSTKKRIVPAAILVPQQEFQRVSRLKKDMSGTHVLTEEDILNQKFGDIFSNEFPLTTESSGDSFAIDSGDRSSTKIAHILLDREMTKIKETETAEIKEADSDFQKSCDILGIIDEILKELRVHRYYETADYVRQILQNTKKQINQLEVNLEFTQKKNN